MGLIMRKQKKPKTFKQYVDEPGLKYIGFRKQSIGFNEKLLV